MNNLALTKLDATFKKSQPACAVCGYDAEWFLRVFSLERLFCENCMTNAGLDMLNFNGLLPSEAAA